MMSVVERNPLGADGIRSRFEAVTAFIAEARQITHDCGVGDAALERIGQRLVALARRTELFPREHFPIEPGSLGSVYRLANRRGRTILGRGRSWRAFAGRRTP
jgi:hypothetical protein